jgi:ribonuclease HI
MACGNWFCQDAWGEGKKVRWRPPEAAWQKLNADGAWTAEGNAGGGGVIVRDHNGRALACACYFFPSAMDPEAAELLACRRALMLAKDMNVDRVLLEMDCMGVVNKLRDKGLDRSAQGPLVEEIKKLMKGFMMASVTHVHRSGNEVAHSLAQDGCKNKLCKTWLGQVPDFVGAQMTAEAEF